MLSLNAAASGAFGPDALMTWAGFDDHYAPKFLPVAMQLRDRYPEPWVMTGPLAPMQLFV